MNRILFEKSEIVGGRAIFADGRAEHVLNVLHGEVGQRLKTGELDGLAGTYFEPASGFGRQDWWQVELKDPVSGRVKVETGDSFGAKTLKSGYVEFSRNGRTWRRGGSFSRESGRCEFRTQTQFQFLRIRSNQGYDCPFVIRQLQVFGIP